MVREDKDWNKKAMVTVHGFITNSR